MWDDVPGGSCVEAWFDRIAPLGAHVDKVKDGWYSVWCPDEREFYYLNVLVDVADDCYTFGNRLREMRALEGLL